MQRTIIIFQIAINSQGSLGPKTPELQNQQTLSQLHLTSIIQLQYITVYRITILTLVTSTVTSI